MHAVAPIAADARVPAAHDAHVVCASSGCCVPGSHHVQSGLPTRRLELEPAGQSMQPSVEALA